MHKNAQKVSKKLGPKFPPNTPCCSMVKIACVNDAFLEVFLTTSKPSRRSITAAKRKETEKRKGGKKNSKNRKAKNFDFCACPSRNIIKCNESSKKGKLSGCKCIFDQIKANLAKTQPKNHQNVQRTHFLQKGPGVNGLIGHS